MPVTESDSSNVPVHNFICEKNRLFKRTLVHWADAGKTVPVDITAIVFSMSVLAAGSRIVLRFQMGGGGLSIISPNKLVLEKSEIEMNIPRREYTYELVKIFLDSTRATAQRGKFIVK